jgi:diguanylate cyclase (GGDEF)-like protein
MPKKGFFLRDKSLRKKFPDKINAWNAAVNDSLTTFSVVVSSFFLFFCIFNVTQISIILFALIAFSVFIAFKLFTQKYIKMHMDKSTVTVFVFWELFITYIAFMNEFVYQAIPGYLFGLVLIFMALVVQASFSSIFLLSSGSTLIYLLFVFISRNGNEQLNLIVALTSYALTLLGSNIITSTRTVELADLTELQKLSSLDPLTRLLNRRSAQFLIENKLNAGDMGCFVVVDIDNFKSINDTNGHLVGDKYLQDLSNELRKCCTAESVVGRIGGDEFIVYLTDYNSEDAITYAKKVKKEMLSYTTDIEGNIGTVSMGIAKVGKNDTYSTLFERADLALYDIKLNGKDNFAFYEGAQKGDDVYSNSPIMLIVDDTFITRKLLQNYFEDQFVVLQAENGEEALRILSHNTNISVILLDMKMPVMDGSEFLKQYKQHESIAHIPVVVITADPTLEAPALAQGAVDMIVKPFDAKIVKLRVHNAVNYSK